MRPRWLLLGCGLVWVPFTPPLVVGCWLGVGLLESELFRGLLGDDGILDWPKPKNEAEALRLKLAKVEGAGLMTSELGCISNSET